MVCIEAGQRCVVILSNDVRSEAGFGYLVKFILGDAARNYAGDPVAGCPRQSQTRQELMSLDGPV